MTPRRLLLYVNELGVAVAATCMTVGWYTPAVLGCGVALVAGAALLVLATEDDADA